MPIEWTPKEIADILGEVDIPGSFYSERELLTAIGKSIDYDELVESQMAVTLGSGGTAEAIAVARVAAERQARQISGNLAKAELNKIADKVKQNIAEGGNPRKLAKELGDIAGLDRRRAAALDKYIEELAAQGIVGEEADEKARKMREKLKRDRGETIARTEQRMATSEGNHEIAGRNGAKWKRWSTVGDSRVDPKVCQTNEAQGWIRYDETFAEGGVQFTPGHPRCRCTILYRSSEPTDRANKRAEEDAARTAEAISGGDEEE